MHRRDASVTAKAMGDTRGARWARISFTVVACLTLFAFPIGTLIAAYLLSGRRHRSAGAAGTARLAPKNAIRPEVR